MPNRDLIEASIDIDAPPSAVWAVVSDLKRMSEWSPTTRKMIIFGGEVKEGAKTLNINRAGWKVWPTRSKIKAFEPERRLAFRIPENGTIWSYTLEPTESGTRLTESRTAPHGVKKASNALVKVAFGGTEKFENGLEEGIRQTLARIKSEVEGA